ncbi:nucleotide sugar dehydrogenase [Pelotomaculum propionicicum]|uniref:UDP-N-acetyl-D-glucosamine 6-dehydrogenase n=1 Tax=Pelotomaculum propionicicum TaxID=258475 RepID=A0A4Y7RPX4_9FIRM|nr:nucleotide sugar dehydrogenase [Pelotomaculum propionicicum]TEB11064.1 UDP-N-acetyl-D-glucosamine 6-dehydrogenase [Pelotomaculum propionicicum]
MLKLGVVGASAKKLKQKILNKTAVVSVIGLGYVGLPMAIEKAKIGFKVMGIEQNSSRTEKINRGENYINDVNEAELKSLVSEGKLSCSISYDCLPEADVIIICVPTPLTLNREPDISYIQNVTQEIAKRLRPGQLITLESTTYPGTTREVLLPPLEKCGLEVGHDFFLAYAPERVDPGNGFHNVKNTSRVVGGITPTCLEIAQLFYNQAIVFDGPRRRREDKLYPPVTPVSSPEVAELSKLFENTYRAVNIALVNELMFLCDRMDIDVWEVIDAAATKPFGIQIFHPGPGVGGHCIPIDPFYLTWKARQYDFHTRFIELAGEINIEASYYVVRKLTQALNRYGKSLRGANIFILGVTYKKDIRDIRESPALKVISLLLKDGANISYYDPYVQFLKPHSPYNWAILGSPLVAERLKEADCVLILTDHSGVDYEWVVEQAKLVLDTRNATKDVAFNREKIIRI